MSSSSSKPAAPPSENPQLQLSESISVDIPPDPGNSSRTPQTRSPMSSNNHAIPQNGNQTVTFRQVFHYWWSMIINVYQHNHNIITSPNPIQLWLNQNVYPLVTPMRIFCFTISQISFLMACGFFTQTELYKSYVGGGGGHPYILQLVAIGRTVWLTFIMFFSFCLAAYERYMHHYLLKSLGELIVMVFESLLFLGIGHNSGVAGLLACGFLTIHALCIINLLKPGHHYSLLEATATLTLHLGWVGRGYLSIPTVVFIFVILVIKNFLWRHIGRAQAQAPAVELHELV